MTPSINSLLDTHLASFAASFSDSSSASALSDRERERTLWRDGLLRIWGVVEPTPGTEGDQLAIERVSAFLVLLQKVSADVQDDEDSALVTRSDIGKVWWRTLLRRTILGTPKEPTEGEKEKAKGKRPAKPEGAASSTDTARPLTVSREAIGAARRTIVWGMSSAIAVLDQDEIHVTPFCLDVCAEFETRSVATLRGGDDWYGLRNVAECIMAWAERQTRVRGLNLHLPSTELTHSLRRPSSHKLLALSPSTHLHRSYSSPFSPASSLDTPARLITATKRRCSRTSSTPASPPHRPLSSSSEASL